MSSRDYRHLDPRLNRYEDNTAWWAEVLAPYANIPPPPRTRAKRFLALLSQSPLCPFAAKLRQQYSSNH